MTSCHLTMSQPVILTLRRPFKEFHLIFKIVELKGLWKHIFRLGVKLYKQSCFRAKVSGINILYSGNRFYYSLCFHFYCGFACGVADGKSITSTGSQVFEVKSWFNVWESKYILLRKGRNSIFFDKDRVSFRQVIFLPESIPSCIDNLVSLRS